jgi:hypothetical protein
MSLFFFNINKNIIIPIAQLTQHYSCHTRTSRRPFKNYHWIGKRTDIWYLVLLGKKKVLFKESPPNIMVTRNHNWSTEILWYETGYAKGKILSPLKRPTWDKLHCWFCLKLLKVCSCSIFIGHPIIFPTLASMNRCLRIFSTLALVNIV